MVEYNVSEIIFNFNIFKYFYNRTKNADYEKHNYFSKKNSIFI